MHSKHIPAIKDKVVIFLSIMANMIAGGLFFLLLLLAVEPIYKNAIGKALTLSALIVTSSQIGRLLLSSSIALLPRIRRTRGLPVAFACLGLAFLMIYLSARHGMLFLVFISAILMGFGHSLSNIELRTIATTADPPISLNKFTVYSFIGWFWGVLIVGVLSCFFQLATIALLKAIVSVLLFFLIVRKCYRADPIKEGEPFPENQSKLEEEDRIKLAWILIGVFINSSQVTLFNASIVVFIKTNLKLSNIGLSLILSPVFLAGLILLLPQVTKKLEVTPKKLLWQIVQCIRILSTFIVLTTTSLPVALLTLPVFGLLMNLGFICQLNVIKEMMGKRHQKFTHSLAEITVVIGGMTVTALTLTGLSPGSLIALIAGILPVWFIFPNVGKRISGYMDHCAKT